MRTRNGHGTEVHEAPMSARGAMIAGFVLVLVLALAVTTALVLFRGGAGDVVTRSAPPVAALPATVAPLALTVEVEEPVTAGELARLTVRWTDGSGIFSGSSEDWGDDSGTSSRQVGRCEAATSQPSVVGGAFDVRHTWDEPGTYTVAIAVATYSCESGSSVEEEARTTLTVDVLPAG